MKNGVKMVKKLDFGLKNLVIKKIPRRLLFIGSALFIGFGSARHRGSATGTVAAREWSASARTRSGHGLPSILVQAFHQTVGVHEHCSGRD